MLLLKYISITNLSTEYKNVKMIVVGMPQYEYGTRTLY